MSMYTDLVHMIIRHIFERAAEDFLSGVTIHPDKQLITWIPSKLKYNIFEILGSLQNILDISFCCWPRRVDENRFAVVYRRKRATKDIKKKTLGTEEDIRDLHTIVRCMSTLGKKKIAREHKVVQLESSNNSYVLSLDGWLVGYIVQDQIEAVYNADLLRKTKLIVVAEVI